MGLRCSLLGHAYGEPVTERDRERRGDEAVVTVRKLRTCRRCGAETVLSENTEVRHLDSIASGPDSDTTDTRYDQGSLQKAKQEGAAARGESPSQPSDSEVDVSELVESTEGEDPAYSKPPAPESESPPPKPKSPPPKSKSPPPKSKSPPPESESPAPETDDGIIIEEGEEPETASEPTTHPSEPAGDTTDEPEEPATGADSVDDIEAMSADSGAPEDAGTGSDTPPEGEPTDATASTAEPESMFGTGTGDTTESGGTSEAERETATRTDIWKERPPPEDPGAAEKDTIERDDPAFQFESYDESAREESRKARTARRGPSGIVSEGPIDLETESHTPYESLVCPECGFTENSASSLRAGDICPECHRGYLAGRR